jgi:hypothetical protein
MPNWCSNFIRVSHEDPIMIDRFIFAAKKEMLAQTFIPIPEKEKNNWYNWRIANWGTKWDFGIQEIQRQDNCVSGYFDTAWGPPVEWFRHLELFGFVVDALWHEGGMCFAGSFSNGEAIKYNDISYKDLSDIPENIIDTFGLRDYCDDEEEG